MLLLIIVFATVVLFAGFLSLTAFEARSGMRVLGGARGRLDAQVSRAAFIFKNVDMTAFLSQVVKDSVAHFVHFIAHLSLLFVREIEKTLTQLVRYLRGRRAAMNGITTSAGETSPFVETMAYFKHTLRRSKQAPPPVVTIEAPAAEVVE